MRKAAIYTRISKDKTGEEAGVERQLDDCRALVGKLGWDLVRVYSDNDISAFSGKTRPGFEDLLSAIGQGQIDALVCWHPDRLYRTLKDLVRLLDVGKGVEIRSVKGGDIDLSTSAGRMMAGILGSVANQESEHHSERRVASNKQRALAGRWASTGMRCYGYDRAGVPLEPEAGLLRKAAKEILAGRSLSAIAREMNAAGHRTVNGSEWTNLKLRRALMTPRIAALSVHQGQIVGQGKWEPIIDESTWRGLCAFLTDPSRRVTVSFDRKHIGTGLYRCGYRTPDADPDDPDSICGRKLSTSRPHGRGRSMVYACKPEVHLARNSAELDRFVETVALGHLASAGVGRDLRQADEVDIDEIRTERDALQATKDQLATLFRKGILDMAGVERESAILTAQIADLNTQMATAVGASPVTLLLEDGEDPEVLADEEKLAERWKAASPDIKSKLIADLMDVVVHPSPRGRRHFDPDLIEIRWK